MPRTKEQFTEMREKSRTRIIHSALRLFSQNGYHGVSMLDIAKDAGVAAGLVYNYFKGKKELLAAIMNHSMSGIEGIFNASLEQAVSGKGMAGLLEAMFATLKQKRESWRFLVRLMMQPDAPEAGGAGIERIWKLLIKTAEEHYKSRKAGNAKKKALALASMMHAVMLAVIIQDSDEEMEVLKKEIIDKYDLK